MSLSDFNGGFFMNSRKARTRVGFSVESLEGRIALSGMGGLDDGPLHHRGAETQVERHRHGADDPANHDANDNKGMIVAARHGANDPVNHDHGTSRGNHHRGEHPGNHR